MGGLTDSRGKTRVDSMSPVPSAPRARQRIHTSVATISRPPGHPFDHLRRPMDSLPGGGAHFPLSKRISEAKLFETISRKAGRLFSKPAWVLQEST
jgi:hypothetical protein